MTPQPPLLLYWVTDKSNHNEDWFVLARDPSSARFFHAGYTGHGVDEEFQVEVILEIPDPSFVEHEVREWHGRMVLQRDLLHAADLFEQGLPAAKLLPQGPEFPRHARVEDLTALGFECSGTLQRIVRYQGHTFLEGDEYLFANTCMDDDHEARGEGRPNGTLRRSYKPS